MASILIAEDSSVIQNLIKKVLSQNTNKFEFTTVKNGKSLLEKFYKSHFDLLLVDVNMPQMSGMDCVREIRTGTDKAKKNVPILAITGNADNLTEEEYRAHGFDDLIEKPLNFDLLVRKVNEHLA